jgi:hypothetical protein
VAVARAAAGLQVLRVPEQLGVLRCRPGVVSGRSDAGAARVPDLAEAAVSDQHYPAKISPGLRAVAAVPHSSKGARAMSESRAITGTLKPWLGCSTAAGLAAKSRPKPEEEVRPTGSLNHDAALSGRIVRHQPGESRFGLFARLEVAEELAALSVEESVHGDRIIPRDRLRAIGSPQAVRPQTDRRIGWQGPVQARDGGRLARAAIVAREHGAELGAGRRDHAQPQPAAARRPVAGRRRRQAAGAGRRERGVLSRTTGG